MKFVDRIKYEFALRLLGVKASSYGSRYFPEFEQAQFAAPSFQHLVAEAYKSNGAVFSCAMALTFAFSEAPLELLSGTAEDHTVLDPSESAAAKLLAYPNQSMSQRQMMQFAMTYMCIGGACYLHKLRNKQTGFVEELIPYSPGHLQPEQGKGMPWADRYSYQDVKGQTRYVKARDVIALNWAIDPTQPHRGMSPLVAVSREIDTDNEAQRYVFNLLKNDTVPRMVLQIDPSVPLTTDMMKRQKAMWKQKHGGENRGGVGILDPGMTIAKIGATLDEFEPRGLRELPESRICAAMRVPPIVAGLDVGLQNATYSNYEQAKLHFVEGTMLPLWAQVGGAISEDLRQEFALPDNVYAAYDTSRIHALRPRREKDREWALASWKEGLLTMNQSLRLSGLPETPGGERYNQGKAELEQKVKWFLMGSKAATLPYVDMTEVELQHSFDVFDESVPAYARGLLEAGTI